jgi:hypothetical protein
MLSNELLYDYIKNMNLATFPEFKISHVMMSDIHGYVSFCEEEICGGFPNYETHDVEIIDILGWMYMEMGNK